MVLWLFWFVLNTIFQQEPFQKRRNNLSRAGSLAKHGGNTGGSAASGDPSENGFGPSERGLVRTPRGSLPGKAALGPAGTLFNGRQRFPIVTITEGQARPETRVQQQPGEHRRPRDRECSRAAAPDTRPAALARCSSVLTAAPGAPEPLCSWMTLSAQFSLRVIFRKQYYIHFIYLCSSNNCLCDYIKLM